MIRKATDSDEKRIFEIFSETSTPWSREGIKSSICKDEVFVFDDGAVSGVIACSKVLDEGEILNFAVTKNKRGQKIGQALLEYMISYLSKQAVTSLYLDVRQSNTPAISLYKKVGFENAGIRKNFYQNPGEHALLMVLNIK